jgi:DnaJ-class molecular chaperone
MTIGRFLSKSETKNTALPPTRTISDCPNCKGIGQFAFDESTRIECNVCRGTGKVYDDTF